MLLLLLALQSTPVQATRVSLEPCTLPGVTGPARCGVHRVFEHRNTRQGRTIPIFVAVLPAEQQPAAPDPLFVVAGGPGQAATGIAGFAATAFSDVRRTRDLVFVDLAGTGRSAPLACAMYPTPQHLVGDFYPLDRVRRCRDSLSVDHDLRRYTTTVLMDDLDEVREALGYDRINLYGTSYGTRAVLEYLRRHGRHVRTVVLKAVVPPSLHGTMHYARDTEHSLGLLFAACAADSSCARAFPQPGSELREVLARADRGELRGMVPDPGGGPPVELPLGRGLVASTLLGLLQNSNSAVRLPLLVHRIHAGDSGPLMEAIVAYRRGLDAGIAFGMHLSVACSEDAALMDTVASAREDSGTALGSYRVVQAVRACREWPRGPVPGDFHHPIRSSVPVLLVSGTLDPNTNERWGAEAARYLTRGTHVVIPNLSHGFSAVATCGAAFMAEFIAQGSARGIDFSCKDQVQLPPFPVALP